MDHDVAVQGDCVTLDAAVDVEVAPRDRHGDVVPVATSGGWLDDHTARVEVIFLESPHRMDITCSLPARIATAAWRGVPLDGGRLHTLHRPR